MSSATPTPPAQTVVIERRDRPTLLRRILFPLLFLILALILFGNLFGVQSGLPSKLSERYVAGDITAAKVAIIDVSGMLLESSADHILKQIRQARDDDSVMALIIRINSPGGSVSSADQIWRELSLVRKPIVASMGDMAASGGYYVAAPADIILAEPTTLTGSIGVVLELPQIGGLMDKLGVKMETVATGPWKEAGSLFHTELSDAERQRWNEMIQVAYNRFLKIVARDRKLTLESAKAAGDGRLMTAEEALSLRLVDRIGYLDDAIQAAWNLAKLDSSRVIRYARPMSLSDALLSFQSKPAGVGLGLDPSTILHSQVPKLLYLAR